MYAVVLGNGDVGVVSTKCLAVVDEKVLNAICEKSGGGNGVRVCLEERGPARVEACV